ncbi:Gmad2 immunoglobulin-like domain-containing protein [Sporosarcina sp. CAU 1771]
MKNLIRLLIAAASCLVLTACLNLESEDSIVETENETPPVEEQTEDATETDENTNVTEEEEPAESEPIEENDMNEVVVENDAFQIFEPTPNAVVENSFVVRGLARVFEGTIQYEFEDGHFILDKGFTTASLGGPEWGEFEIPIDLASAPNGLYRIILYEESAADGSRINELIIPVKVGK